MKTKLLLLSTIILGLSLAPVGAQFGPRGGAGGPPMGPRLSGGDMQKLFGEHSAFSADLEFHSGSGKAETIMPGKIALLNGLSRFEMNMSEAKGPKIRAEDAAHMKEMGMDQSVMITRPDKKLSYRVYPGMQAYLEDKALDAQATTAAADYQAEVTELGRETIDDHPCIKSKVVMTGKDGKTKESTVWNATDLRKFPVKIEGTEDGKTTVLLFKNVKLESPAADLFEPPKDFKKHDSFMSMMMEKMGGMPMGR